MAKQISRSQIQLSRGKLALIDEDNFEYLNQWKWQFDSHGYATRRQWIAGGKGKTIKVYLHRLVMDNPVKNKVDHINGNKLDCIRTNLRVCTHSQNLMNRGKNINNTSGFKNIFFDRVRNKWRVEIKVNYKPIYIGRFTNKEDAIKEQIVAEKKYFGEYSFNGGQI